MLRIAVARPRWVLSTWLLLLIAMGPALGNLEISTSTDSVLDRASGSWGFYQTSIRWFGGDEVLVVALEGTKPSTMPRFSGWLL